MPSRRVAEKNGMTLVEEYQDGNESLVVYCIRKQVRIMQFELAQEMNKLVESNYETSNEMKSLCRKIISEGCVLLENDGVLPLYDKKQLYLEDAK